MSITQDAINDRKKVHRLQAAAEDLRDDPGLYFPARSRATKALADWRTKYPEAAKEEHRASLLGQADDLRVKARGAFLYDADGSLSRADQQARHDDWMRQADAKTAEAESL